MNCCVVFPKVASISLSTFIPESMAFLSSAAPSCHYTHLLLRSRLASSPQSATSLSFPIRTTNLTLRRSSSLQASPTAGGVAPAISLTDNAMKHLNKMKSDRKEDICLRIGVKQGGCSGMSYTMEFENRENARPDDSLIEYNGFTMVCDPKSLLFLFGMQLDYSDALIGGGFSFQNPNATQTCGCGKSFAAEM